MCMTVRAAKLFGTKIYAGEAMRDGKYVHILAYSNGAQSDLNFPNAMILPIPAVSFGKENAIDASKYKGFINSILDATKAQTFGDSRLGSRSRNMTKGAEVFKTGSYTVVTSDDPQAIVEAFERVPEDVRPKISQELVDSLAENYPKWPLAVCCWKGAVKPEPLLFWYEPKFPRSLFAPALDAHDGKAPRNDERVKVDHIVAFGSTITPFGESEVRYNPEEKIPSDVKELLPTLAVGQKLNGLYENGDFYFPVENLAKKRARAWRWFPKGDGPLKATSIELGTWG